MIMQIRRTLKYGRRQAMKLFAQSGLAVALLAFGAAGSFATVAEAQEGVFAGRDKWLFPGWEKLDGFDKLKVDKVVGLMTLANDELAKRKIGLLTVVVPAKAIFHRDKLPENRKVSADLLNFYPALQKELAAKGIASVDLSPALSGLPKGEQAFFRTDFHWTAWASEAAAKATANVIKSKWQLAGNAGDGAKLGEWTKERRFGDLAAKFMTPEQRREIGREVFTVRGERPAAGGGLLDDAAAPVHVVGNSFTAPYLGFSQALSHDLDRRVTLTWNPGDVGPWATLLQYIQSDDFKQNPPQVIVWQFNESRMQAGPSDRDSWVAASIMSDADWQDQLKKTLAK